MRVLFDEISRILNHLLNVPAYALDVGAMTPMLWAFEEREKLMEFYEGVCGARLHAAYYRVGGVHQDMPANMAAKIEEWADGFPKFIDDMENLLTENRIFKQRSVDIGIISPEDALAWGMTGPVLRGSGVRGTSARRSPTTATTGWISTFPSARTATATAVTWCGSRSCASRSRSSSSVWRRCRPDRF
jgi:NADH-quinone oxidoreductase subunit D